MRDLIAAPSMAPGPVAVHEAVTVGVMARRSYVRLQTSRCNTVPIDVLGTLLPTEPGVCNGVDPIAWWAAPDAWLIESTKHPGQALVAALESACAGRSCAIVDVSDSLVAFEVRGPAARELLTRGTGFDVRAASFKPGRGTRTCFAQLAVLLRPAADTRFELLVDRSSARWLADWLSAAASTYS